MALIGGLIEDGYHFKSEFGCAYCKRVQIDKDINLDKLIEESKEYDIEIKLESIGKIKYVEISKQGYPPEEDEFVVEKINMLKDIITDM